MRTHCDQEENYETGLVEFTYFRYGILINQKV